MKSNHTTPIDDPPLSFQENLFRYLLPVVLILIGIAMIIGSAVMLKRSSDREMKWKEIDSAYEKATETLKSRNEETVRKLLGKE